MKNLYLLLGLFLIISKLRNQSNVIIRFSLTLLLSKCLNIRIIDIVIFRSGIVAVMYFQKTVYRILKRTA